VIIARPGLAIDRRFAAWSVAWGGAALLSLGLVAAIIPNPVFGRQIPPEPFAIVLWLLSAPLVGIAGATYTSPAPVTAMTRLAPAVDVERRGAVVGSMGGFGMFLAIGCPMCNKIALLLLGASGAMSIYGPIQPVIGVASLGLLGGSVAWRLRLRARGGACPV
jgi:hypothetical protein